MIIQAKLNAPKSQFNKFGNYKYRSCEDILAAVKPLLAENKCVLTLSDDMVCLADRIYVKATATLTNASGGQVSTTAFAREEESKKGMDGSQVTGASSSYARKYALNGLFAIDDTKDSDATNTHGKDVAQPKAQQAPKTMTVDGKVDDEKLVGMFINEVQPKIGITITLEGLKDIYNGYPQLQGKSYFMSALSAQRKQIEDALARINAAKNYTNINRGREERAVE